MDNTNTTQAHEELLNMIREELGQTNIPPTISKQIGNYCLLDDMTYKEIAQCIVYYVEVRGLKIDPIYGLKFVSQIRPDAAKYFEKLRQEKIRQEREAEKVVQNQEHNIIFNIKYIDNQPRRPKLLDIGAINMKEDSDD